MHMRELARLEEFEYCAQLQLLQLVALARRLQDRLNKIDEEYSAVGDDPILDAAELFTARASIRLLSVHEPEPG